MGISVDKCKIQLFTSGKEAGVGCVWQEFNSRLLGHRFSWTLSWSNNPLYASCWQRYTNGLLHLVQL